MELHPTAGLRATRATLARNYRERLARGDDRYAAKACEAGEALARDGTIPTLAERLRFAGAGGADSLGPAVANDTRRGTSIISTPPIKRSTMAPRPWSWRRRSTRRDAGPASRGHWHRIAATRRTTLLFLVLAQACVATSAMVQVLPYHGAKWLEVALLLLFAILIGWISAGFWTALAGFLVLMRGHDRYAISGRADASAPIARAARTAVVMPICNEDVARVFAGLRATYQSVARSGELSLFDFFVLSDSSDADARVAEGAAWLDMCAACNAFGRLFYRQRQHRIKRKSGNIADFCRRWGKNYRYMVVLDADSVMSGRCLVELVRMMEANTDAGIIQTAPHAGGRDTLYARIQQFAARTYGPLFVAGMHYWQLGEAHYWGHNAIIRVAPFIRHCALARLPGHGTLSGEILSHDFVEAALMRRAGWGVWIAYDLPGSYEEMPPNLLDELKRDRRWCQGNLINSRLFFAHGLHPAHRAVFVTGVMAYASAPLWFAFLVLSTVTLAVHTLVEPEYFTAPNQLFPLWPQWHPARATELFAATATVLFLPKLLGVVAVARELGQSLGGFLRLLGSALIEWLFSALLAPIRMLFHAQFVAAALTGWNVVWKSPSRDDAETTWGEAIRRHGAHTLLGLVWAIFVYWLNPAFLWWLLPVAGALIISIPMSVASSRVALGRRARDLGLFLIPEESQPPRVLRDMRAHLHRTAPLPAFVDAAVDPLVNAISCASEAARLRHSDAVRVGREVLVERAVVHGPSSLSAEDRLAVLGDAAALVHLHEAIWTREDLSPAWQDLRLSPPLRSTKEAAAHADVFRVDEATTDIAAYALLDVALPAFAANNAGGRIDANGGRP